MAEKIKLENLVDAGYDTDTGDKFVNEVEEYVCSACRHLVSKDDKFCQTCGEELTESGLVEHHYKGQKLSNKDFSEARRNLQ